ncbi:MAG: Mrp/NBP35 family ATP-binding protein [Deltaproteobacteria bacterium]|nr:Mrp/NBP35 family ATP-binding protein [Deltaproteobacteria bacterium]
MVTTPQEVALSDVRKSITFCQRVEMPIVGLIENLSGYDCPQCGHHEDLFSTGGGGAPRTAGRHRVSRALADRPRGCTVRRCRTPLSGHRQGYGVHHRFSCHRGKGRRDHVGKATGTAGGVHRVSFQPTKKSTPS